jgi:hypothetical protein
MALADYMLSMREEIDSLAARLSVVEASLVGSRNEESAGRSQ